MTSGTNLHGRSQASHSEVPNDRLLIIHSVLSGTLVFSLRFPCDGTRRRCHAKAHKVASEEVDRVPTRVRALSEL